MTTRAASKTAALVAAYRARATARPERVCDDPWAAALAGEEGQEYARLCDRGFPHGELWLAVRTRYLDEQVRRLTAPEGWSAAQVVLLGAGLDTRAARLRRAGVRFFEVDQPGTQAAKLERLRELEGYPVDAATYVACDFEHQDFMERLAAAGFDADAPAVFVWEGVTYYLTEAAVRATLGKVAACHPRSVILFDYVHRRLIAGELKHQEDRHTRELVADLGEPFRWGIDDVLPFLYEQGFRYVRTCSYDEACLTFTGTYERARKFRFQRLCLASRAVVDPV